MITIKTTVALTIPAIIDTIDVRKISIGDVIMANENLIILTDSNFKTEIANGVALVDFWAAWCGPCRMVGPLVEELAVEYAGKAKVGKVDVDENQNLSGNFGVMSIPTLLIMKDGVEVERIVGAVPKATLASAIDKHL